MNLSKKKYVLNPKIVFDDILKRLKNEKISYDEFLSLLSKSSDRAFDNAQLEFELLLINGLPLDIEDNFVFLKTNKNFIFEQTFCFVDIETNGGTPKKGFQIIEIGAIKYKNGQILDSFNSLVFAKEIPSYIQEVTNINLEMLKDAPRIEKVLKDFKEFLADDVFVAHDVNFDYNFISDSLNKYSLGKLLNRKLCTINLAKRTIKAEKYGLSTLKELLNINVENHHRAYFDALTTKIIFEKCLELIDLNKIKSTEDLINFSKSTKLLV